jgi:phosphoadenosine phosphosulfate reductase
MNLFQNIKTIASQIDEAILFFSGGKDSLVTLDLLSKYKIKIIPVFMYYCKGLSFRERYFKIIEKKYKIKIEQIPHPELSKAIKNKSLMVGKYKGPRLNLGAAESYLREKYNISWIANGFKKHDTIFRRAQLSQAVNGIDNRLHYLYPVGEWSEKNVMSYIKKNKLPLMFTYHYNFRDLDVIYGDNAKFIYNNYPDDFEKLKAVFPLIEAELLR